MWGEGLLSKRVIPRHPRYVYKSPYKCMRQGGSVAPTPAGPSVFPSPPKAAHGTALRGSGPSGSMRKKPLRLQRRHAAAARGRDGLAPLLVLDVPAGKHARDAGLGGPGLGDDVARLQ